MRTLCRIHECELSALGGKLLAPHEQASFAEGSFCAPFVRDVRTLDDNGVSLDKGDGTEQEVDSPAADATGLGVTVMQQAHVHCVNTSFLDLGIGVAVRQNGSAVVVRCTFRPIEKSSPPPCGFCFADTVLQRAMISRLRPFPVRYVNTSVWPTPIKNGYRSEGFPYSLQKGSLTMPSRRRLS